MKKSKTKIFVPLTLLALLIVISGCIGQSQKTTVGQNGLVIADFYTDPPENNIESGETMDVMLFVENVGGTTAKNVVVELLGADWIKNRLYSRQNDPNGIGSPINTFDLTPPSQQYGTPGQMQQFSWLQLPTPYVPEGLKKNYNLKARVTYEYGTSAGTDQNSLKAYSKSWFDTLLQQGKITSVSSNAIIPVIHTIDPSPIVISVTGPDKIIVPEQRSRVYTYKITVSNVGGGVPITEGIEGLVYTKIWLNGPGYFVDCMGIGPNTFDNRYWTQPAGVGTLNDMLTPALPIYQQYTGYPYTVDELRPTYIKYPFYIDSRFLQPYVTLKLRRGESVTKSCTIGVENPDQWGNYWGPEGGVSPSGKLYRSESSFSIFFELNYKYYLDADTTITVSGWMPQAPLQSGQQPAASGIEYSYQTQPICGDGVIDEGEQCDGTNLGGYTCRLLGYDGGQIRCSASCIFDTSSCTLIA